MISKKDVEIISHLRNNARKKITVISKAVQIPVTTAYDRIRAQERKLVKKHTTLLNFPELGFHAKATIAVKANIDSRDKLREFLIKHPNVNTLSQVDFGSDYLVEVIFRHMGEVGSFVEDMQKNFSVSNIQVFNIIKDLKKEEFLTRPEHYRAE